MLINQHDATSSFALEWADSGMNADRVLLEGAPEALNRRKGLEIVRLKYDKTLQVSL